MKKTEVLNYVLIDEIDKYFADMKKALLFFSMALVLAACTPRLTEKVVGTYPDGNIQKAQYCNRKGECVKEVEYYESGQVKMEGSMKGEKREGEWKAYFPDGRVQSIGTFVNGLRTGKATIWQENGNLLQDGFFEEGKHVGKWKFYDEQGNLMKEVDFGK